MDTVKPANPGPSLRVLLVEDSADDAELLGFELADQGYTASLARVDTPEALDEALDRERWDVVLCDRLPGMDALSALSSVQARGLDVPFIIVSSVISESSAIEVMRAGAHDFLFKHSLGRLGAIIERELRESGLRAERRRMQQQLLLADRLTSVGMLAAGVAHEINNPLAYVLGNVEFALNLLEARGATEHGELGEVIQALLHAREGSERIRHITRDLKVFCRGRDEEPKAALNVRQVMESSIRMAWNEVRHRARLSRDFERVASVLGHQSRLGQVFLNLLVNAAQALPEDRLEQNEIIVRIRPAPGRVELEVEDNGSGMTPEQQKRAFEPFFTTKPHGVGSGIGLAICASIVSEMGGELVVESRLGQGTKFRVLLPAHEPMVLTARPPQLVTSLPPSRILVIDDEPAICAVVRRLLRHEQHDLVTFTDARAALALLKQDAGFDVIICDIMMPYMSGIDFFAKLQELEPELAGRTLFMTGGALNGRAREFLGELSHPILEKPFETGTLHAAIARLLESRAISGTWLSAEVQRTVERAG